MCLKCHSNLSNNAIKEQLLEALNTKNYIEWNTTSINHILIILSGHNGNKNKILATQLLSEFVDFLKIQSFNYYPTNGLEGMY